MRRRALFVAVLTLFPLVPLAAEEVPTIDVAAIVDNGSGLQLQRFEVPVSRSADFVEDLSDSPPVIAAGVVNRRHTLGDPRIGEQWGLARLDLDKVRELGTGDGVIVAVVDTGVDGSHPELADRVLPGLDLVDEQRDGRFDPNGHGTHVAGIIAAGVDGSGMEGLAPKVRILPVRALGPDGSGDDADVAYGILWAVRNGAQVVNLSLGGTDIDPLLEDAVNKATAAGVIVVAASGNSGANGDVYYPAAHASVVAVAATGPDDNVALYSTRGSYVDVAAPGTMILSSWPGGGYRYESGTSMATPFVAAAAAILLERGIAPGDAVTRIVSSAYDLGVAGRDTSSGAGFLDVVAAATTGQPRAEQPKPISSPTVPTLPTLPTPTLPTFPSPSLPTPTLPDLPGLPPLPGLPDLPSWSGTPERGEPAVPKPTQPAPTQPAPLPVPTQPEIPSSSPPIRRTLTPAPTVLTGSVTRSSGQWKVTVTLRTASFPLAYRPIVVVTDEGGRKRRTTLRTDAKGAASYTFPAQVRSVVATWAGDVVTAKSRVKIPVDTNR